MIFKKHYLIPGILLSLLCIPFTVMQFTNQVQWNALDFFIIGILLLLTGITITRVLKKYQPAPVRILLCVFILLLFIGIWAELAVGLLGSPFAGN